MATRPKALQRGDTVGIVTLASPYPSEYINQAVATLEKSGLQVVLGKYVYSQNGFLAGTDDQRASDLMSMFTNKKVKMIMSTRGGTGSLGILPHLDYRVIASNPKIVSGYSDISIVLNVLNQRTGLITFLGLMLEDFVPTTPAYNFNSFYAAVSTFTAPRQILNPPNIPLVSLVPGNVTGPVVGGNMTTIVDSLGTPFEIDTKGKILLLEEQREPPNKVYRYLNHLKLAGKLSDCIGIIIGECTDCIEAYGKSWDDVIHDFLVPLGKPLIKNLTTSHGVYKTTIPIGANINLDTRNNKITILEPTVSW
ncbi:LD-carboxypeptidase [Neobacillus mesonae]|uniref:S66 peptidase family protein n=1 Tax=Neobacillus mesonae TaxID=1193713 RepID=UPI002E1E8F73|nr:LD-carboxypeptidase [Neobacillus mesonae]